MISLASKKIVFQPKFMNVCKRRLPLFALFDLFLCTCTVVLFTFRALLDILSHVYSEGGLVCFLSL